MDEVVQWEPAPAIGPPRAAVDRGGGDVAARRTAGLWPMKRYALLAGLVILALAGAGVLGYQLRGGRESVGERLWRECTSIVEAARAANPEMLGERLNHRREWDQMVGACILKRGRAL